jgi:FtsP/CotA-like multicopper oxidase with cupredoxin domain
MEISLRLCTALALSLGATSCADESLESAAQTESAQVFDEESSAILADADQAETTALDTSCAADAVGNPPEFVWTYNSNGDYYSGVLEVSEATFNIDGDTLTTRAYRQPGQPHSIPGPTIRMTPGNKYVLRFHNKLPYEPLETGENVFKDPNASNMHTHGLHISGESPGDDVTRTFEGGKGGDFVYDIPADHMGGTYWYHAHHHGSTFLQVSGGTFGMLLIDDAADGMPQHVADMEERNLVLGYLDPGVAGNGGDTLMSGTLSPTWTINGQKTGSICMPANEWQHWRVLLADRDAKAKTVSFGAGCEVALMARDGVWRTDVPKPLTSGSISLTGASRADFAVRCDANSSISVGQNQLASIVVGAEGNTAVHPYLDVDGGATWQSIRPEYLRDLSGVPNNQLNTESIRMGARTVNGSKYDHHNANLTLPADKVQEWRIGGAAQHPFHLHVYHMQAFGCGGDYEDGEYYDVIGANCDVRFDTNAATTSAYDGRTIMHCHILEHEDQGAMGWMDLQGGAAPPSFPNDTPAVPFGDYYDLAASVCGDATCDGGEDSCNCAADCGAPPSSELTCDDGVDEDCDGVTDCDDTDCDADAACSVPFCGDATCDAGEDSCNCAADCGAPPSSELTCDDGVDEDCDGVTDCDDTDCDADAACAAPFCGDATCDAAEDSCNCAADCGAPPSSELSCSDSIDEDCDGVTDCDDTDCSADAACNGAVCGNGACEPGEDCNSCGSDCDSQTVGPPNNRYCCGDGVLDSAEGDGTICDGNE